jgi:hypothetical protein
LKLKAVVKKSSEEPSEVISEPVVPQEKPKARLIEREHASSSLMKSVMKNNGEDKSQKSEEKKEK